MFYRYKGIVFYDWGRKCLVFGMNKKCGFFYDVDKFVKLELILFGRIFKIFKMKMFENVLRDLVEIIIGLSLFFF